LRPQLIVQVQTTVAPVPDAEMTAPIQEKLAKAGLKPEEQIVDTGYVDAELLVSSHQRGIKLVGPTMPDSSWQAKAGKGFDLAHFSINWGKQQATCPQGQQSSRLSQAGERMEIVFARRVLCCVSSAPGLHSLPDDWSRPACASPGRS
jgi:transposase